MYENRRWLIIPSTLVGSINFNEIKENSLDSLRFSLDGTKTFVKYDVTIVESDQTETHFNPETRQLENHITKAGIYGRPSIYSSDMDEYTNDQIMQILDGPEWSKSDQA